MTIADLVEFKKKLDDGQVTADQVRQTWNDFKASTASITAELKAMKKDELKAKWVGFAYHATTKERMVDAARENLSMVFVAGGSLVMGLSGGFALTSREAAIDQQMDRWTDELIQKRAAARREKIDAERKALTNPETLQEFDRFISFHGRRFKTDEEIAQVRAMAPKDREEFFQRHGESKLKPEQLARYDELRAAAGREVRDRKAAEKHEAPQVKIAEGLALNIMATTHTKHGYPIWVVQLSDRVDRPKFEELSERAKALGGYYSSFRGNGAIPGFTFKTQESAEKFRSLEHQDAGKTFTQILEEKQAAAAAKLAEAGERIQDKAAEVLETDRKTNTARRAMMATAIEGRARAEQSVGESAVNVANAIKEGAVRFLDRVSQATQIQELEAILRTAQGRRVRADEKAGVRINWDEERHAPFTEKDIAHATMPWPVLHSSRLRSMVSDGLHTPGAKLAAVRARNLLLAEHPATEVFTLRDDYRIKVVRDLAQRVGDKWGIEAFKPYDRMLRMSITNDSEVRAALREYLPLREGMKQADPIVQAERALIGTRIPGFFPTPPSLAKQLVERADIQPGMRVLEPEVGKGDLYEEIRDAAPTARIDTVEVSQTLQDLLEKKNIPVTFKGDFLQYHPGQVYDRIVMNPPFENGADIEHVKHAFSMLKPGGKLVAIMSEGPFFREDSQAKAFRSWAEREGGASECNPEGAFAGADAFRQTGTATRIFSIEKGTHRVAVNSSESQGVAIGERRQQTMKLAV